MRILDYIKKRRAGFSHRACASLLKTQYLGDTVVYVVSCAVVIFFALHAAAETIEGGRVEAASNASERAAETVDRLEKVVVSCLNGNPISVDGFAFTCKAESLEQKL